MKGYFSNKWNVSRVYWVSEIKTQLQVIAIKVLIDILDDHWLGYDSKTERLIHFGWFMHKNKIYSKSFHIFQKCVFIFMS